MKPLVVWDGGFGRAVVRAIERELGDVEVAAANAADPAAAVANAACVALVSWRWCDATAVRWADAARAAGRRFFLAQLDGRLAILGPHLGVDGPCYQCFRGRFLTHDIDVERRRALWQLFAGDASAGVPGFTPSMVRMAAAATLDAFAAGAADPTVRCVDVLSGDVVVGDIAAIHACRGLHGDRRAGSARFVTALQTLFESNVPS